MYKATIVIPNINGKGDVYKRQHHRLCGEHRLGKEAAHAILQLFLVTNILGTQNLLDAARRAWVTGKDKNGYPTWRKGVFSSHSSVK